MSSTQTDPMSELYCVCETFEDGRIMVTASPEIWVNDDVLYWPPKAVDRSVPTPPQPDWTPILCKVLKRSIGKATVCVVCVSNVMLSKYLFYNSRLSS